MDGMKEITPEQRLENVAESVLKSTEVKRQNNGKGRPATYADNVDVIAQSGRQLAEMIIEYLNGELESVWAYDPEEDIPF